VARLRVIQTRAGFLAAVRGIKAGSPSFVLQARRRRPDERERGRPIGEAARVGYTCSKKVGNAVARNRAKRRLRAASDAVLSHEARPGWDYVLIGVKDRTADSPFAVLCDELRAALSKVHARVSA
jgi:ribonuclease P protein component